MNRTYTLEEIVCTLCDLLENWPTGFEPVIKAELQHQLSELELVASSHSDGT